MDPAVVKFVESICDGSGICTDFFTRTNINALHVRIVEEVGRQLAYCIQQQSEQQLLLLMRSMWARYGRTLGVAGTNDRVVAEAVQIIQTNIEMHDRATQFLDRNPEPMAWGESTSMRGTKLGGGGAGATTSSG